MKYRWESNGGCATCDQMDGIYDEPPVRPHDYCNCRILAEPAPEFGSANHAYFAEHIDTEPDIVELLLEGGNLPAHWIARWQIVVECCSAGVVHDGVVYVENHAVQDMVEIDMYEAEDTLVMLERIDAELLDALERLDDDCPDPDCLFV